ncbi:MAG TPA: GNAT family N-acetyltransferase [Actinomycetota bacterium]|nr:GNAT family N-acetyltransferase [Actinomycetota bacterium]
MAHLEPLLRFWRAQDDLFERTEAQWWGAVVSDARFPAIQEPNYARVETRQPVRLEEIEDALHPAMRVSGSESSHVVIFHPEDQTDLIAAASTRGDRIAWDLVMVTPGRDVEPTGRVEEVPAFEGPFWVVHRDSARLFDVTDEETLDQLQAMEREVLIPAGRRWFAVVDDGRPVALAALLVLERTGFIDHVVTFPDARRHGHAEALTRRIVSEATAMGAERTYLLAEPQGGAVRIYDRIGFERVAHLASWLAARDR